MSINGSTYRDVDIMRTWCLDNTLNFTRYMFKHRFKRKFVVGRHHIEISNALQKVLRGEITRLMINIAPRYGKTELAVKNFVSQGLAINPAAKFIHLSYSDDLALDNSAEIQSIIMEPAYQRLFNVSLTSRSTKKWYTTEGGGLYAVSSGGQVTGFGAGLVDLEEELGEGVQSLESYLSDMEGFGGAIIIDDPIKPDDALSDLVREKVNNKFDTTIRNRVNSRRTPIIIIMQRLHENDLCGYLLAQEPDEWTVLSFPCIYTDENGEEQALWPFKHTLEELKALREKNSFVFDTQYLQDPKPREGLLYSIGFREYETIPASRKAIRKNYTDTADEGKDFLCSICYVETETANYITDVLYTQKGMEFTEPETAKMLSRNQTQMAIIESNNGGRSFARAVEQQCRIMGNNTTSFKWFHQSQNKQVRIFTQSAEVQNVTFMPVGWQRMWPQFHKAITQYMKIGNNKHDDGPDALTGCTEWRGKGVSQDLDGVF